MTEISVNESPFLEALGKLRSETALLPWVDLQRFFAQGKVLEVASTEDLLVCAAHMAMDNRQKVSNLQSRGGLSPPSDDRARQWYAEKVQLWTVVVAPFVLVQEMSESEPESGPQAPPS
ncbi:MAG: DUF2288 family protein [Gammaproteobacteria bacterium]|nr:DUF2288 family protein [Gammaproteobacteria bacterium]